MLTAAPACPSIYTRIIRDHFETEFTAFEVGLTACGPERLRDRSGPQAVNSSPVQDCQASMCSPMLTAAPTCPSIDAHIICDQFTAFPVVLTAFPARLFTPIDTLPTSPGTSRFLPSCERVNRLATAERRKAGKPEGREHHGHFDIAREGAAATS